MADAETYDNSYSSKDIFFRELIHNPAEALNRIRFESLTDKSKVTAKPELFIYIIPDKTNNRLSIIDSGTGMTKADLVNNLGTITSSGTKEFMEALAAGADASMIEKFGVGFYSAYLVAEKVSVTAKHNDDEQCVWESQASGSFTVTRDTSGENLGRGTKITLSLWDDQLEYLEERRLKDLIKKQCEFITYPISFWVSKTVEMKVSDDEDEEKDKKKMKEVSHEWSLVNKQKPIWMRKLEEITEEEYAAFYKSLTNDWEGHLAVKLFAVEGQIVFKAILFIPRRALSNLFDAKKLNSIKLCVHHVFVTDNCGEIIPEYLSFVKGIVDFGDLPLNISREMLQWNKILKLICENLVKKCIELFFEIAANREHHNKFYEEFSENLKLGILEDFKNRTKIVELLRFHSTKSSDEMTGLKDYVTRMKEGQNNIYYITGESQKAVENSPCLKKLKKMRYEVLLMVDAINEYTIGQLKEFEGKQLVSATEEGLKLDKSEDERKKKEELRAMFETLCKIFKDALGDKVEKVIVSNRLVYSPCCLVTGEYGRTANTERIMKAQTLRDNSSAGYVSSKKTMEINPENPTIDELRKRVDDVNKKDRVVKDKVGLVNPTMRELLKRADANKKYRIVKDMALLLFESLDNPVTYRDRVRRILNLDLTINKDDVDADGDMPPVEGADADADAEGNKMEEVHKAWRSRL